MRRLVCKNGFTKKVRVSQVGEVVVVFFCQLNGKKCFDYQYGKESCDEYEPIETIICTEPNNPASGLICYGKCETPTCEYAKFLGSETERFKSNFPNIHKEFVTMKKQIENVKKFLNIDVLDKVVNVMSDEKMKKKLLTNKLLSLADALVEKNREFLIYGADVIEVIDFLDNNFDEVFDSIEEIFKYFISNGEEKTFKEKTRELRWCSEYFQKMIKLLSSVYAVPNGLRNLYFNLESIVLETGNTDKRLVQIVLDTLEEVKKETNVNAIRTLVKRVNKKLLTDTQKI